MDHGHGGMSMATTTASAAGAAATGGSMGGMGGMGSGNGCKISVSCAGLIHLERC